MRFSRYLSGIALVSCLSFDSNLAIARGIGESSNLTLISQAKPIRASNKKPDFSNITVRGYTIPVCTDSGVALKETSVEDLVYLGRHDVAYRAKQYLGRLTGGVQLTCKVTEFRTKRSNYTDFLFLWTDYLGKFGGSYRLVEGTHGAPYGLYRLVYPDKWVQYIAVYFHSAGGLQLSVGSFPRDEKFARDALVIMMGNSGLGRPRL
ncbi:MAG: hypothetical protein HC936_14470 [Leptolyngbyaceae cyanobacterium SU_3_3]|nr:hypothetical protein [Leptolyngbyaceae cyanobacterium SU_3_3]